MMIVIVFLCLTAQTMLYRNACVRCSTDIKSSGLQMSSKLTYLDISGNSLTVIEKSAFRNQGMLKVINLSGNKLQSLESEQFSGCTELRELFLSANNISEINPSSFHGLGQLELLDLSNNRLQELDPLVFQNPLNSTNRQTQQVSMLKHLNLAQNKIRSFNFELYFPLSSNSETSTVTFELESLNISANCLNSVSVTSVKWLNNAGSSVDIDLSGNPFTCVCSGSGEACSEEEQQKPYPFAKYPTEDRCRNIKHICPAITYTVVPDSDNETMAPAVTKSMPTESPSCGTSKEDKNASLVTTLFVVNGALLVCTIAGGSFIVLQLLKRLRKSPKVPEHYDTYIPLTGKDSTIRKDSRPNSKTEDIPGHVYETIN